MRYSELKISKNTVVVGASCGVGAAVCTALCRLGHNVIGVARTIERLQNLQSEFPENFKSFCADVREVKEVRALADYASSEFESYDVVNMVFGHIGEDEGIPIEEVSDEDIADFCNSSVLGNWYLAKYLSGQLRQNSRRLVLIGADWGFPQHNVLLGSVNSDGERIGSEFFVSAKHAITGLANSLERLSRVECVGIYPGAIASMNSDETWLDIDTPFGEVQNDPLFANDKGIPLIDMAEAVRYALESYSVPKSILIKPRNLDYDGVGI